METRALVEPYFRYRAISGDSLPYQESARIRLKKHFLSFLERQGKMSVEELTPELIKAFQEEIPFSMTPKGSFLTVGMRNLILQTIKSYLGWLYRENYLATDLSGHIEFAKTPKRLPKNVLEEKEVIALLKAPDLSKPAGFRDRVMLEILYGTGIRLGELKGLTVEKLDLEGGYAFIEEGKGKKDRVVPLGKGLCGMIEYYLKEVRPRLLSDRENPFLIPSSQRGGALSATRIQEAIKKQARGAGITKRVYPHLIRHTCATHMTQNGAPIRCVQELLGHSSINTTQVYTHLTIQDLKKAHARYHPRERITKKKTVEKNRPGNQ